MRALEVTADFDPYKLTGDSNWLSSEWPLSYPDWRQIWEELETGKLGQELKLR